MGGGAVVVDMINGFDVYGMSLAEFDSNRRRTTDHPARQQRFIVDFFFFFAVSSFVVFNLQVVWSTSFLSSTR
jgi:hypothetical protein